MKTRYVLALMFAVLLFGCEGSEGPMGPQGIQGPEGKPGPGTRVVLVGQLDYYGVGAVDLPAAAGTLADPPAVACYISSSLDSTAWLIIATANLTGSCGLVWGGSNLRVGIVSSLPYWYFKIVVVY